MAELADVADSKSVDSNIVWVRIPLGALRKFYINSDQERYHLLRWQYELVIMRKELKQYAKTK